MQFYGTKKRLKEFFIKKNRIWAPHFAMQELAIRSIYKFERWHHTIVFIKTMKIKSEKHFDIAIKVKTIELVFEQAFECLLFNDACHFDISCSREF